MKNLLREVQVLLALARSVREGGFPARSHRQPGSPLLPSPAAPLRCCGSEQGAGARDKPLCLPFFLPSFRDNRCQNRVGGFLPVQTGRLLRGAVASHSKMPSFFFFPFFLFFLNDAPFANATQPWEDSEEPERRSFPEQKPRSISLVPFIQLRG